MKRRKKKKKAFGYFYQMSPGNPDYNAKMFNHLMGSGDMPSEADMGCSVGITESRANKNTYEIKYISKSYDRTFTDYIDAFSYKQALYLCRKLNNDVYRIVDIYCIVDNSNDEEEQISLFDTHSNIFDDI